LSNYDLEIHESLILAEACRVADRLDQLAVALANAPLTTTTPRGEVVNPLLIESRMAGAAFAKLIASMRLPSDASDDADSRPQRRGGSRGSYGLRKIEGGAQK